MSALVERLSGRPRVAGLESLLEGFVGLTALAGGLLLVAFPRGSALAPIALLHEAPFETFVVPGLLLAFVVGGLNLTACVLTLGRRPFASLASLVAGGSLIVFMVTERLMLQEKSALQLLYFAVGLLIVGLSVPDKEARS